MNMIKTLGLMILLILGTVSMASAYDHSYDRNFGRSNNLEFFGNGAFRTFGTVSGRDFSNEVFDTRSLDRTNSLTRNVNDFSINGALSTTRNNFNIGVSNVYLLDVPRIRCAKTVTKQKGRVSGSLFGSANLRTIGKTTVKHCSPFTGGSFLVDNRNSFNQNSIQNSIQGRFSRNSNVLNQVDNLVQSNNFRSASSDNGFTRSAENTATFRGRGSRVLLNAHYGLISN